MIKYSKIRQFLRNFLFGKWLHCENWWLLRFLALIDVIIITKADDSVKRTRRTLFQNGKREFSTSVLLG